MPAYIYLYLEIPPVTYATDNRATYIQGTTSTYSPKPKARYRMGGTSTYGVRRVP